METGGDGLVRDEWPGLRSEWKVRRARDWSRSSWGAPAEDE